MHCVQCGFRAADKKRVGFSNRESAVAPLQKPGYAVELVSEVACGLAGLKSLSCAIHHCRFFRATRAEPLADAAVIAWRTPMHFVNGT